MEPTPTPTLQPGIAELQRKRRLADRFLLDFLTLECELQGTPFLKVTVTVGTSATFELVVEKRRKVQKAAA